MYCLVVKAVVSAFCFAFVLACFGFVFWLL